MSNVTTEEIVRQIRDLEGVYSAYTVAKWFNIDATTVQHIWSNQVYKFASSEDKEELDVDDEFTQEELDELRELSDVDELDEDTLFDYAAKDAWGGKDGEDY